MAAVSVMYCTNAGACLKAVALRLYIAVIHRAAVRKEHSWPAALRRTGNVAAVPAVHDLSPRGGADAYRARALDQTLPLYWLAALAGAVPLGTAGLLITPLLPELIVSLLVLSTRLQPVAPAVSAAIDTAINVLLRIGFMTTVSPLTHLAQLRAAHRTSA